MAELCGFCLSCRASMYSACVFVSDGRLLVGFSLPFLSLPLLDGSAKGIYRMGYNDSVCSCIVT